MKHTILSTRSSLPLVLFLLTVRAAVAQGVTAPEPNAWGPGSVQVALSAAGDDQWNKDIGPFNADGPVYATAVAPNGDLYVGGEFSHIGGISANRIARWDGSSWMPLGTGIPAGTVYAIAFSGGDVIVGGHFRGAGDVKATNIARFSGNMWLAFGDITKEGLDSTVLAIAVKGNDIYVGGNFTYAGNQDVLNYIAVWDIADTVFVPLDDGTRRGMDGGITTMAFVDDDLYVGGAFTKAGGTNASRIARWNGTAWSSLTSGVGAQGSAPFVTALAVRDTAIFVAGTFAFAGGKPMKNIAQWSTRSNAWYTVGGAGFDSGSIRVAVSPAGTLFVSGLFQNVGSIPVVRIAQWNPATGWAPLGSGLDGPALALAATDEHLWVGGAFANAGGKASPNLARWTYQPSSGIREHLGPERVLPAASFRPNPAAGAGRLSVLLPEACAPRITIVNERGEVVAVRSPGMLAAGEQIVPFDLSGLAPGLYFCRVACRAAVVCTCFTVVR
ncbi:MAG TPA: hypothetical protein VHI13_14590 [Candidatus Kapabacteria bacterium]|nr:hypothetical protein [Candidatus Kapabacteria bacterium]